MGGCWGAGSRSEHRQEGAGQGRGCLGLGAGHRGSRSARRVGGTLDAELRWLGAARCIQEVFLGRDAQLRAGGAGGVAQEEAGM